MPCSHTMEPHFIPDAYCAMKASSKKELDDIWSVCHPGCPAISIDTLGSIGHSLCLKEIFTSCLQLYATPC